LDRKQELRRQSKSHDARPTTRLGFIELSSAPGSTIRSSCGLSRPAQMCGAHKVLSPYGAVIAFPPQADNGMFATSWERASQTVAVSPLGNTTIFRVGKDISPPSALRGKFVGHQSTIGPLRWIRGSKPGAKVCIAPGSIFGWSTVRSVLANRRAAAVEVSNRINWLNTQLSS